MKFFMNPRTRKAKGREKGTIDKSYDIS